MRGKGEGSVYQRGDGRWVAQVDRGRLPSGRRHYSRAVRKTRTEAVAALRELNRSAETGVYPDRTRSTEVYLRWWLDEVLPGTVAAVTEAHYRRVLELWVIPHVGRVKLGALAPTHVQAMLRALERQGLSTNTRRGARSTLSRALRWAEVTDLVSRNAATLTPGPKGRVKVDDALTAEETRKVLAQVAGDRLEALAVLALTLGLRQGELLALRWSDVDLDTGLLRIDQSKTLAGERTLPLVRGTADALRDHRRRQAAERLAAPLWLSSDLVFTGAQGQPLGARHVRWWWHKLTEAALGERRRFHSSRHTAATLLLEDGVPLEIVSAVLGHATLAVTADVYTRIRSDLIRRSLER